MNPQQQAEIYADGESNLIAAWLDGYAAANAKIAELERVLDDRSSNCDFCDNGKPEKIKEPFAAYGVTVESEYWKCANCLTTWLSGRQNSEVDMKIKDALNAKIEALSKFAVHMPLCGIVGGYGRCTCGLDEALHLTRKAAE